MRKFHLRSSTSMLAAAFMLTGMQASAQDAAPESEEAESRQATITVTARKFEESILEAPIAITAFDAEAIQDLGLQSIEDIQLYSPGFVYESHTTQPGRIGQSPRFRGIETDTLDAFRQTASVFVDGLYLVAGAGGVNLADVERVEVIKGPQSALFGRNSFGGAVNFISKTPGDEFAGDYSISLATRNDYEASIGVEGPLIGDVLKGRVSGYYHFDGGHYENTIGRGEDLGEQETMSVAGTLFFEPNEKFSAKLRASYFENDDGPAAFSTVDFADANCGPFNPANSREFFCGELPITEPAQFTDLSQAFFDSTALESPIGGGRDHFGFDRDNLTIGGSFDYDILDNLTLSVLLGHSKENDSYLADFVGNGVTNASTIIGREFTMDSQEVRLSGDLFDERVKWLVGYSHFEQEQLGAGGFFFFGGPSSSLEDVTLQAVETTGVFASLAVEPIEGLTFTFEGRSQEDEVTTQGNINFADLGLTGPNAPISGKFDNFLPRFIVDYQVTDDTLIYATYAEGNNPGGFNNEVRGLSAADRAALAILDSGAGEDFDEEGLKNYEAGLKQSFPDGKGSLVAAVFFMERFDQQFRNSITGEPTLNGGATVTYNVNRGTSEAYGIELEGDYRFTDNFSMIGSLGILEGDYILADDSVFDAYFGTRNASGQELIRYPRYSGSLSGIYDFEYGDMPAYVRADAAYVGRRHPDIANLNYSPDGVILNLRAGIDRGSYQLEAFALNVTDSDVPTGVNRSSGGTGAGFLGFSDYNWKTGLRDKPQVGVRVLGTF